LERELGGGGMSRVFVAEELRLKRKVVVKVLSPELAQGINVERFEREIQTVAALQQANIVPVLSAGDSNGLPFYTMPYVESESLRARLGRGPLAVAEVIGILRDVTRALAYAHQRAVVHRDIKPDNVLISGGTAVVTDFGIAKAISASRRSSGGATLTQIGTSIGTPAYMAPEQAAGDPQIDARADIYSLGAMAYELLTGQVVFAERTPQRMLAAHMGEAPAPIATFRADLPASLADLVMSCLAKDPKDRPQRAGDIARVLETITSGSGMQSMPPVLLGDPGMFRTALLIYVVAFVAVAILAKAAIVGIGLPDWVFPGALIVMALGLPVVLWTGYVQRVTRRAMTMTPTYTPGGTPSMTHSTIATMALKAAPKTSWHRTARGGAFAMGGFAILIALFMVLRAFGIGPFGSLLAAGKLSAREPILLTDFRTTNVDSSLGRVVSDAVRAGLAGSSAFTLVSPASVASELVLMKQPPSARVDSALARQIAVREGVKAIVDGDVTGVPGGYIVSIRLVRADSGTELASFRETGDGPRGLIDAADRLARSLRGRAGESLRSVNATPALFQATTSSLDALRKFSEGVRANLLGDMRSVALERQAVAIDPTFASAWSALGAMLSNYGGSRSAIDSAITQAYRFRDRLPSVERGRVVARYYGMGPGRDRAKGIAALSALVAQGDTGPNAPTQVNLAELLRTRREFAAAESLNWKSSRQNPKTGTPVGNIVELQLDQGKVKEATATLAHLRELSADYASAKLMEVDYARGDIGATRRHVDSLRRSESEQLRNRATQHAASLALLEGRLHDRDALQRELAATTSKAGPVEEAALAAFVGGPSAALSSRLDSAIATTPFRELPFVDRPYFTAAIALAVTNNPAKASAMMARYRSEVTDTTLRRAQEADEHVALGYVALAAGKPQVALIEFRRGDVGYDGMPANECAPCLPLNLARAFEAAGQRDSAAIMYERYLSTPAWFKLLEVKLDPLSRPPAYEHLGQLYEAMGNPQKAAATYRQFIELWKNADPELQPRVAEARRRLAKLTPVEKPR
jgi:tetratricopeptide (TPR) repeat protein